MNNNDLRTKNFLYKYEGVGYLRFAFADKDDPRFTDGQPRLIINIDGENTMYIIGDGWII